MSSQREIERAAAILREGGLVAFPTETVYGLGADAENDRAVGRIFAAKGRPADHPLIVHLDARMELERWADEVPESARRLAERFWPGPLTMILARRTLPELAATGGQASIGLRVPSHPLALALLQAFGGGIAAPSANRFGHVSPTTAAHVREELGERVDAILDGGPCSVGIESTIVDLSQGEPVILRPGGVPAEAIEALLGQHVPLGRAGNTRAPGLLASHYAPRAELLLVSVDALADEVRRALAGGRRAFALAPRAQLDDVPVEARHPLPDTTEDFARHLYAALRELDVRGADLVLSTLPLEEGLGLAIADRLRKAAAPRER
jgi:L-threonylcarbamoyladenylate synthase